MTDAEIAALKAAAERAPPAPWFFDGRGIVSDVVAVPGAMPGRFIVTIHCQDDDTKQAIGRLIAAAPALLARLAAAERTAQHYRNACAEADDRAQAAEARAEQVTAALAEAVAVIEDYLAYEHDGDPWSEDARAMGEMEINDYGRDGRLARAKAILAAERGEGGSDG